MSTSDSKDAYEDAYTEAAIIMAIVVMTFVFWLAWTYFGVGATYAFWLPSVYQAPSLWSCFGIVASVLSFSSVVKCLIRF